MSSLTGKAVLITGGARGIGAATARQLVGRGARVAVVDSDIDAARRLVAELGSDAAAFEADVTSSTSMVAACDAAAELFGRLDVVVANAGIAGPAATVARVDPDEWRRVIEINLFGVMLTVQAALRHVRTTRGYVLAVASIGAVLAGPTVSGYMASKAAVESLTRSLRVELAADGVDVGIAYFGLVDTGLARDMLSGSGIGAVMAGLPFAGTPIDVDKAATAMTTGILKRSRRIYAPGWVRVPLNVRSLALMSDRLLANSRSLRRVVADVDKAPGHR